jgi:hypothetical protein
MAQALPTRVNRYMKMTFYLDNQAEAYGCLEELKIDPKNMRPCTSDWNITVQAVMPHTGITMKIKPKVILE